MVLLFFFFSYTPSLPTLAYVTYQDLRTISSFQEQTVIAVKAPPETRLEVPDFSEVCVGPGAVPPAVGSVPGCCRAHPVPHGATWGISRVQPSIAPSAFGVSPWGCLTPSGSFGVVGVGWCPAGTSHRLGAAGWALGAPLGAP